MRVLIVHDSLSDNGGVRVTLDVAGRLQRLDASAEVFALQPVRDGREVAVAEGVRLTRGVPVRSRLRVSAPGAARRLLRACRRADVVLSGSELGLGFLAGYAAARLTGRPFAVVVHAPLDATLERWVQRPLRPPTRFVHRRVDVAICVAPSVVAGVTANGLDPARVYLVANAVDVERIRRLAGAGHAPDSPSPIVVGLGRLSAEKGFDLLVRAHAELRQSGVEHELELIGVGPERERLQGLAAELGVADSVTLPGFVENRFPRLARAAALVLPSRHEGMPLVLLEALALGVPVIASRSAGASDVLPPEHLVADGSAADLAAALRRLLENGRPPPRPTERALTLLERTPDDVARDYLNAFARTSRSLRAAGEREAAASG